MSDTGDGTRIIGLAALGALAGSLAVYLLLTPSGRQARVSLDPTLDDLTELLRECRRALRKGQALEREARAVAEDVRAVLAGDPLQPVG